MTIEQTVVKTLLLTGPITLYEVSAVCESLRIGPFRGQAAPDRFERFGALGPGRLAALDLMRLRARGIAISRFAWRKFRRCALRLPNGPGCLDWLLSVRE